MGRTCTMGSLPCSRQSTESSTQWVTQQARSRISMTSGKVGGALRSRMLFCVPRALASSSPVQPNKFSVQVRSGQVRSGQVRSGQVRSGQEHEWGKSRAAAATAAALWLPRGPRRWRMWFSKHTGETARQLTQCDRANAADEV